MVKLEQIRWLGIAALVIGVTGILSSMACLMNGFKFLITRSCVRFADEASFYLIALILIGASMILFVKFVKREFSKDHEDL